MCEYSQALGIWMSRWYCVSAAKVATDTQNETPGWSQPPKLAPRSAEILCTAEHWKQTIEPCSYKNQKQYNFT